MTPKVKDTHSLNKADTSRGFRKSITTFGRQEFMVFPQFKYIPTEEVMTGLIVEVANKY